MEPIEAAFLFAFWVAATCALLALLAFLADDVMPRAERWWRTTLVVVDWRGWWPHVSFHGVGRAQ